jgi:predicted XRE-type DNA-binding protein
LGRSCVPEKIPDRTQDPATRDRCDPGAHQATKGDVDRREDIELALGSANVFRDFGHTNADVEQTKAILAAKIIGVLDDAKLSTRQAQQMTGVNHSEFARIGNVRLERFTIDRLIIILNRLNQRVEFDVTVRPAQEEDQPSLGLER